MKLVTFLLALYSLALSTVPCFGEDKCMSQYTQSEQTGQDEGGCNDCCSPFISCGTCCGFTVNFTSFALRSIFLSSEKKFALYKQTFYSQFAASIWQPPKIG